MTLYTKSIKAEPSKDDGYRICIMRNPKGYENRYDEWMPDLSPSPQLREEVKNVRVAYEPGDLNKVEDIERIVDKAKRKFGRIDILVNCAGVFPVKSLQNSSLEDFENCFNVNIRAPFLFCKAFSESMIKNQWGRIVNIGSSSAYGGFKNTSIYCASKHAILGLSRALHCELK